MFIMRNWSMLAGARSFNILVGARGGDDPASAFRLAFQTAVTECEATGLAGANIVRSRIWARDAATRQIASNIRLDMLAGARRAASSSFIASERLAPGIDMIADIVALEGGKKIVREYEPAIAPPMFVGSGGFVFLSGYTDISATFEQQLEVILSKISRSLEIAGTAWGKIVKVDAYVAQSLDQASAWTAISARFPCPVAMTSVEGYSAPEKRVEIEVTALQ